MADQDPGYSPFVQAVAGDGTSPPDVRLLSGWLGASGEEGYVRLYLDASLSTYVDIPKDAILYSEEIANSHPAGQRTVWVKGDADLKEGGSAIARAAKFLFGQVQKDFLGGGTGAQPAAGGEASAPGTRPEAAAKAQVTTPLCLTYRPGCERTGITGDCQSNLVPCTGPGPGRPFTQLSCSAIGACGSNVCGVAAARTDSMMGCFDAARTDSMMGCFAADFRSMTDVCPQTQSGQQCHTNCCHISDFVAQGQQAVGAPPQAQAYPPSVLCLAATRFCPRPTIACPTRNIQCVHSAINCPTFGRCPSAVDACPSSLGCTFACNVDFTVFQQTPVLQQQPQNFAVPQFEQQQQFAQQQVGATSFRICSRSVLTFCPTTINDDCPLRTDQPPCPSAHPRCHTNVMCPTPIRFCPEPQTQSAGCESIFKPCDTWICGGPASRVINCLTTGVQCGVGPSAVDACPSSLGCTFACNVDFTVFQQTPVLQQQPQFAQQFAQPQQFAQQQVGAPGASVFCESRFACPAPTILKCPRPWTQPVLLCYPPASFPFGCVPDPRRFANQEFAQPQFGQQPQFNANVFGGGGFVGAGPNVPITQTPSALCITDNCRTPIIACPPPPNPSTVKACSTAVPALCPDQTFQPWAAACVGQTFQTGASCPCPPQTGAQCVPPPTQQGCPPVSHHPPQCCFGQTFQTGIQGCDYGAAQNCVGQTFQTGHTCPCPPPTGAQCVPPPTQQGCPPPSPPPRCCVGQTFQTGHSCPLDACQAQAFGEQSTEFCPTSGGCGGEAIGHTAPGWCGGGGGGQHTGHPCITGGPCTGFAQNVGWTSLGCGGGHHTGHPCITGGPCTGFAQNVGWTSLGCNPQTHYPQCNSSVGVCATRPPCF